MKSIIYKFSLWVLLTVVFSGCESYLGGDVNVDPNRTSDASLNTLAPTVMFYCGQVTYFSSLVSCQYAQQIGGVVLEGTEVQRENRFGSVWSNIYLNVIPNANTMIQKALESENSAQRSPHYSGLAKVLLAYNLGVATTIWENIPYSEADNNLSSLNPSYDSQEDIYADIMRLLTEAIEELNSPTSLLKPGSDDVIYNGDISKWIKAAHSLKARYGLHLAGKNVSFSDIIASVSDGFSSGSDDLQLIYTERNFNPWYSVALANNTGNLTTTFSSTLLDLMNGADGRAIDPRTPIMAYRSSSTDTVYRGNIPGTGGGGNTRYNNGTEFFGWYHGIFSPIQMMTYAELKFIEAEAHLRNNNGTPGADAYNAYLDGIRAHMNKLGVPSEDINAYLSDPTIDVGMENLTISHIMTEKYKALFLNPETWNDLRRYNYSNIISTLRLPENHNIDLAGQWIQRGFYPETELARNRDVAENNFKPLEETMWIFK